MFPVSKTWLHTSSILKPFEPARMPSWASTPCFKNCRVLNHHIPMRGAWQTPQQSLVKPWAVPRSCSECENRERLPESTMEHPRLNKSIWIIWFQSFQHVAWSLCFSLCANQGGINFWRTMFEWDQVFQATFTFQNFLAFGTWLNEDECLQTNCSPVIPVQKISCNGSL